VSVVSADAFMTAPVCIAANFPSGIGAKRIRTFSANSVLAIDAPAVPETLFCGQVVARRVRVRRPWPRGRVNEHTAEAIAEPLGMVALGKTKDGHIRGVATECVRC